MSDFLKAARIADNALWQRRINMIATDVAVDVLAEDAGVADHATRATLAKAVVRGDQAVMAALPKLTMTNETVRAAAVAGDDMTGSAVPDGDILYTVTSLWTALSKSLV